MPRYEPPIQDLQFVLTEVAELDQICALPGYADVEPEVIGAILEAAGSSIDNVLKLTVFLTDLDHFTRVNEIMAERLTEPYLARTAIGVSALPKSAKVEIDAIADLT